MPNSPSQIIPDMLDWRQIWGSVRSRKGNNSAETSLVTPLPCEAEDCLVEKRCMSGNTCGCRMSWTYRWAVLVSRINTRGDRVMIEAFTTGSSHTNTIVITAEIESGFVAKDDLVSFRCRPISSCRDLSKRRRRWVGVKGSTHNRRSDLKCPSARHLRMVREDTRALSDGAICA
ncbi:uncharacterized protein TNCV_3100861 [Trichonephila clavipes]|nr:uncharacterized protein TNCV_3100861 [Trichonephila clavipes]